MMDVMEVTGPGQPLRLAQRPIPDCPPEGLLIKTLFAGICHSDLHLVDDVVDLGQGNTFSHKEALENNGQSFEGMVLGHEICGRVEHIGKQVSADTCGVRVGDVVAVYPWRGCQQCEACAAGENQLCEDNQSTTTEIGQGAHGGGYGEFVAVPEAALAVRVPASVPPHVACLLPCSALTAYSALTAARPALDRAVRVRGIANLLVVGTGGLGMWAVILVKTVFCDKNVKVICADLDKAKLDAAGALGADDVVQWPAAEAGVDTDVDALVSTTTVSGYNKMDAAIDLVGRPDTAAVALRCLHRGGSLVLVGLAGGALPLSLPALVSSSVAVHGVRVAGLAQFRHFVELFGVQNAGVYPPIAYTALADVNAAHAKVRRGQVVGRAVIKYV